MTIRLLKTMSVPTTSITPTTSMQRKPNTNTPNPILMI